MNDQFLSILFDQKPADAEKQFRIPVYIFVVLILGSTDEGVLRRYEVE